MLSGKNLLTQHDSHVHTSMCGHAEGVMEDYVTSAIDKGLKRLTFLEHLEEGINIPKPSWLSERDFDYYFKEGARLRKKYRSDIEIGLGVECGYNPACTKEIQERLGRRDWDQIGISCHFLKVANEPLHLNLLSKNPKSKLRANTHYSAELYSRYLDILTEAVVELKGTLLCHLDAAFRWVARHRITPEHYHKIEKLLELAAGKDMALEINTSGITIRNEPFPNKKILEIAKNHNMRLQLGSDAHSPAEVGRYFDRFEKL